MTASLPSLLVYFGFESALHFALDDGLYPDKEYSQFDWQAPDGSRIPAASRIPLAIDSASGFLRLADRYNESMQDDHTAALFLARLPVLKTPWLNDLQIATNYAPVLGEFASIDALVQFAPATERPNVINMRNISLRISFSLQCSKPNPRVRPGSVTSFSTKTGITPHAVCDDSTNQGGSRCHLDHYRVRTDRNGTLETLELQHVDIAETLSEKESSLKSASTALENRLNACSDRLTQILWLENSSSARGLTKPAHHEHRPVWPHRRCHVASKVETSSGCWCHRTCGTHQR